MRAARKDPRLDWRPISGRAGNGLPVHRARQTAEQPPPFGIRADQTRERCAAAERGDVGGGITGTAGDELRRVVLENENRRLARNARDLSVYEFVGDQVPN